MVSDGAVLNRWRLVLGKNARQQLALDQARLVRMDEALDFLYGREGGEDVKEREPQGGHGESQLTVSRWLSEIRCLFPRETAEILQRHALDRYQLTELLTDREILERMEPNEALLETILSLKHLMKGPVLEAARGIVRRVAEELTRRMQSEVRRSALGKLDRGSRSRTPSLRNLDVRRTIWKNLSHYDLEKRRLMVERVYFNGRVKRYNPWRVILAVDESGSMLHSIIHSAVMAGIFARLPMLDTRLVIFDTAVVDLSGRVEDPVETLMSVQLGGGTDIAGALRYCESLIAFPHRTMVVLVSDLCEGNTRENLYGVCHDILESGAKLIALTALDETAAPAYDRTTAERLAGMGAYVGAMTPSRLADFMAGVMRE
ncbi:VWA domain-containing protein [Pseudoflavonifractor phocaeensis]|uniref:VWA domain-containing protein n=1 Tax=Pseudoflavonifractor phocaeensis TaxID=1870988 RepID=UPI00195C7B4E|nr:VWA domain-containing protein [Pseudoflavonifractor phocaeensis]MBM6870593.1 VWA domain-containing protein [Pseudoflavonifractor phocaeensis]MBM6938449.1 VWA domain-containing protein [Pseudoflavonifractor phocaeensis]